MTEHSPRYEGSDSWKNNLIVSVSGSPKPLLANAVTALRECPAWGAALTYDGFGLETFLDASPPWSMELEWIPRAWSSHDDLLATDWLQRQGIAVNSNTTAQAVELVAKDRQFHPVLDYLDSLGHDDTPRASTWLSQYLGAAPTGYNQAVGRAMLIAAVARIRDPGCKVDTVPIFEGAQGAMKSTAVRVLFEPWFTDELADLGSKDAAMQTRGIWAIEVSELDAMSRMEVSRIKAFISRTTDRFRPPYGSRLIESRRSCVFWGTTNAEGYLKDETGGRRFWPVKVGKIDVAGLRGIRDQLWAEADVLYASGTPWWIVSPTIQGEAETQQRDRYAGDPWDNAIEDYVNRSDSGEVTIEQVLEVGLMLEINRCGQAEMNRVARVLKSMGLMRRQKGSGATRRWIYSRPVSSSAENRRGSNVTTLRPMSAGPLVPDETPYGAALNTSVTSSIPKF
jgi:predicted P-loop ATPase